MSGTVQVAPRFAAVFLGLSAFAPLTGCTVTTHETRLSTLGTPSTSAAMLEVIDTPGRVEVETVVSSDWAIDRSGLINLDHPKAVAAGLQDAEEPIQVYFHGIKHPEKGLYIVDTGIQNAQRDAPDEAAVNGFIASAAHVDKMKIKTTLGDWLKAQNQPLQGVFYTHLHVDHIMGTPDVPATARLFSGPGEGTAMGFLNLFVQGSSDRAFEGKAPLEEWRFVNEPGARFDAVMDVFGDKELWAILVPGHTPGSTAYLARTPKGPVLMTGDTCHTVWGWNNAVEPGSFTADHEKNAESLERLIALSKEHPKMRVLLGHQALPESAP